jgi:hypothetical protein
MMIDGGDMIYVCIMMSEGNIPRSIYNTGTFYFDISCAEYEDNG